MTRARLVLICLLLCAVVSISVASRSHRRAHAMSEGRPGEFAYYVLSLSWSPQFCAGSANGSADPQCSGGRRFGFVAHGLWPQDERGWPESCGGRPLEGSVIERMLDIMPSPKLIRHEWEKHGTCSGLAPSDYFGKVREAFSSVRIPPSFRGPSASVRTTPEKFRRALLEANPHLAADEVAILCSGRYLDEVRVCFDKGLAPRRCASDVRDHCAGPEMIVRPVR
jgi:ribonuclease T2